MRILDRCENDGCIMGRDEAGGLYVFREGSWTPYDFNALYRGYYASCAFTALAVCGGSFLAAGLDDSGKAHLFASLSGGVWEERNLTEITPLGDHIPTRGRVLRILFDERSRQIYLVTDAGQAVTLPDCPKCVKIRPLNGIPVDARLRDGMLEVDLEGGGQARLPVGALEQYRVSWSYAAGLYRDGAILVDLRSSVEYVRGHAPGSVNVPYDGLADWLLGVNPGTTLLFLCRTGLLADEAASYAREAGWGRAYSMGGLDALTHIE